MIDLYWSLRNLQVDNSMCQYSGADTLLRWHPISTLLMTNTLLQEHSAKMGLSVRYAIEDLSLHDRRNADLRIFPSTELAAH